MIHKPCCLMVSLFQYPLFIGRISEVLVSHNHCFQNLGRFAVRHGMWGFVHKMSQCVPSFVAARRARCASTEIDPKAYGSGFPPNPPVQRASALPTCQSTMSLCSLGRTSSMQMIREDEVHSPPGSSECSSEFSSSRRQPPKKAKTLKGFAAFAVASSLAMIMHRSSSCTNLGSAVGETGDSKPISRASRRYRNNRYKYTDSGASSHSPLW